MTRRDQIRASIERLLYVAPELRDATFTDVLDEIEEMIREANSDGYDDGVRDAGERLG